MARFTESHVEAAALEWLSGLDYAVSHGPDISPDGIVKLTKSSSIAPQDTGLQPVANPPCWASRTAARLNLTTPVGVLRYITVDFLWKLLMTDTQKTVPPTHKGRVQPTNPHAERHAKPLHVPGTPEQVAASLFNGPTSQVTRQVALPTLGPRAVK